MLDQPTNAHELVRAAQYVRMSTEQQLYSLQNQRHAIACYAAARGFEIVRTYEDAGKSGLTVSKRPALQQLLHDVLAGDADFQAILVYDVSRWGRFQDADESAHYEFICRQFGIQLVYCAEPFENDGTVTSTLLKSVKRIMAAEFSRELASKVYAGQVRAAERGFRPNGATPYGFRRMLLGRKGEAKGVLGPGDCKHLTSDRIVLVPGPDDEVRLARQIFDLYVKRAMGDAAIAARLNQNGEVTREGLPWQQSTIGKIIVNDAYIGTNVFGRKRRFALGPLKRVPRDQWVLVRNAFEGIIEPKTFEAAQRIRRARQAKKELDDSALLVQLRDLLRRRGVLTQRIINADPDTASTTTYANRFGTLREAYALIGYAGSKGQPKTPAGLGRRLRFRTIDTIVDELRGRGATVHRGFPSHRLTINGSLTLVVLMMRHRHHAFRRPPWPVRRPPYPAPDFKFFVRARPWEDTAREYYLLGGEPLNRGDLPPSTIGPVESIEPYRMINLEPLYERVLSLTQAATICDLGRAIAPLVTRELPVSDRGGPELIAGVTSNIAPAG